MIRGKPVIEVNKAMCDLLTNENKTLINDLIEYLYHKQNTIETKKAIQDAISGNIVGPFDSIEDFFKDLDKVE